MTSKFKRDRNWLREMPRSLSMGNRSSGEPVDILLVEDHPGDARLITEAFKASDFAATLHIVTDGDDALTFLAERRQTESLPFPELVLLDLNLPRIDGFTVLEELRDDDHYRLLPVLILTGSSATEDIAKSYELMANAYLTKPTSPDEFVGLVQAVKAFWFETARIPPIQSA